MPTREQTNWIIGVGVLFITIGLTIWWFRSPVVLDNHGYDLTMALYRTCNQRDESNLVKIESMIDNPESEHQLSDASRSVIEDIINTARSGDWKAAQIACRRALDDQVRRE